MLRVASANAGADILTTTTPFLAKGTCDALQAGIRAYPERTYRSGTALDLHQTFPVNSPHHDNAAPATRRYDVVMRSLLHYLDSCQSLSSRNPSVASSVASENRCARFVKASGTTNVGFPVDVSREREVPRGFHNLLATTSAAFRVSAGTRLCAVLDRIPSEDDHSAISLATAPGTLPC